MKQRPAQVIVGKVGGVFGVQGWLRIRSHTRPTENILSYQPWLLDIGGEWVETELRQGRRHGAQLVAKLAACDDRDTARRLVGVAIAVDRSLLPPLGDDETYWTDLIGLQVETVGGEALGSIGHLLETGANDVAVLQGERERLIPLVWNQVVKSIDVDSGLMVVDWDPDF